MKVGVTAVLGVLAALALGGAARAADFDETFGSPEYGIRQDFPDTRYEERHSWRGERQHWHRDPDRIHGRPVFARPAWGYGEECRVIVKERVNRWGEVVTRRIRVCG